MSKADLAKLCMAQKHLEMLAGCKANLLAIRAPGSVSAEAAIASWQGDEHQTICRASDQGLARLEPVLQEARIMG